MNNKVDLKEKEHAQRLLTQFYVARSYSFQVLKLSDMESIPDELWEEFKTFADERWFQKFTENDRHTIEIFMNWKKLIYGKSKETKKDYKTTNKNQDKGKG